MLSVALAATANGHRVSSRSRHAGGAPFVPREGEYPELHAHFRAVHSLEGERRRAVAVVTYSGWALAVIFGGYALIAGLQNINRSAQGANYGQSLAQQMLSHDVDIPPTLYRNQAQLLTVIVRQNPDG
jgi:hypothetical protein